MELENIANNDAQMKALDIPKSTTSSSLYFSFCMDHSTPVRSHGNASLPPSFVPGAHWQT